MFTVVVGIGVVVVEVEEVVEVVDVVSVVVVVVFPALAEIVVVLKVVGAGVGGGLRSTEIVQKGRVN